MKRTLFRRLFSLLTVLIALWLGIASNLQVMAQSRRQPPSTNQKKNKRPDGTQQPVEPKEELPPDLTGKPQEAEVVKVTTNVVNVDAVVYHKKSGQIITGLKQGNFAIFEDGVKKEIT